MTDELIEQVARALFKLANGDALDPNETWNGQAWWCAFIDDAHAALAAINLPARLDEEYSRGWSDATQSATTAMQAFDAASYTQGWNEAIEAAATVAPSKTAADECETVGQWTRRTLREAIRALTKGNSDASSD